MDADLKTLGVDGATAYVEGLTASFEGSNIDDIKKQVDGLFDDITNGIREDSSMIAGIVSDAFLIDDAGNLMVDNILTALRAGTTDITYTMQKAIDDVKLDNLIADVEARAAAQSSAGYNLAGSTAGATGTQTAPLKAPENIVVSSTTTKQIGTVQSDQKITIDADLKLTDKAGQVIAEVVNAYNKRIEVGVGK